MNVTGRSVGIRRKFTTQIMQGDKMKIKIETVDDTLSLCDDKIYAFSNGVNYDFCISKIEAVLMITNDLGPFYDDLCLAIRIDRETAIFIMSEHNDFKSFLFDQLGKSFPLDYEKITEASSCTENKLFVIYERK